MKPICFFPISAMILFRACTHVKHIMPFEFVFIKNLTHILRKSIDTPVIKVYCPCVNSCLWMPYGDSGIYFQKSIQPDCASHFSFAQLLRKFQLAANCTLIRKRSQISSWRATIQISSSFNTISEYSLLLRIKTPIIWSVTRFGGFSFCLTLHKTYEKTRQIPYSSATLLTDCYC
jgi:hypothetical protein